MGTTADLILTRVKLEEGFRPYPYKDTTGHLTVGYGWNLDSPMPERLASVVLLWQLDETEFSLDGFAWYQACDPIRKGVLLDMAFNMGLETLLTFHNLLAACVAKDWGTAHSEMLASTWAGEVGARAQNLARIMLTGEP